MKLAYCKSDIVTLKDEVFNMNRFNVTRMMKRLIGGMAVMFMGMSIPAMVFKAGNYVLECAADGKLYDFSGLIPDIFSLSSLVAVELTKCLIMFMLLISIFKMIQGGSIKEFGKEVAIMIGGYFIIQVLAFIPTVAPNIMRYMGYL